MFTPTKGIRIPHLLVLVAAGLALTPTTIQAAESGIHGWVVGQEPDGKFVEFVSQARIVITSQPGEQGGVVAETASDANGYYRIALTPGQYYYRLEAAGYRDENAGRGFRIRKADGLQVYHFALTRGETVPEPPPADEAVIPVEPIGRLSGLVYEQIPGGLAGIPGALVTLRRAGTVRTRQVVTRGPGADGLLTGTYDILLEAGDWWPSVLAAGYDPYVERTTPIVIVGGQETIRDFEMQRRVPDPIDEQGIFGTVTLLDAVRPAPDAALHFSRLPANLPAAAQDVQAWQYLGRPQRARSDYDQPLPPGAYRVVASAPNYRSASRVGFVLPEIKTRIDLVLRPLQDDEQDDGSFGVTVAVVTTDGDAVENAMVNVAGNVEMVTVSGQDGLADFQCLPGVWDVTAQKPGLSQTEPVVMRVGVGEENTATVVMAGDEPPAEQLTVLVVVTDPGMNPIEDATVVLRRQGAPVASAQNGKTDESGLAGFEVTKLGAYVAVARKATSAAKGKTFDVVDDATNVHIVLGDEAVLTMEPAQPTKCQAVMTTCPAMPTVCTRVPTRCPVLRTQCPVDITRCPAQSTKCPTKKTSCPRIATLCPPRPTGGPSLPTKCPTKKTFCPEIATLCPPRPTSGPVSPTKCPVAMTRCPQMTTKCPVAMTRCPQMTTKCPVAMTRCPQSTTKCPIAMTRCPQSTTRCPVAITKCPQSTTKCPSCGSEETRRPMMRTKCPAIQTRCPASRTKCPPCGSVATRQPVVPTKCPAMQTRCPASRTKCPPCGSVATRQPVVLTKCPAIQTRCPASRTKCPACSSVATRQPVVRTKCPTIQTRCPASRTKCPACSSVATRQPVVRTKCPTIRTICPQCTRPRRSSLDRSSIGIEQDGETVLAERPLPTVGTQLPPPNR